MFEIVYEILNNHKRNKGYEKWREGREEVQVGEGQGGAMGIEQYQSKLYGILKEVITVAYYF